MEMLYISRIVFVRKHNRPVLMYGLEIMANIAQIAYNERIERYFMKAIYAVYISK